MPVPAPKSVKGPRRLLRNVAYDEIRRAIFDGVLLPGERLADEQLIAWLQVSRTPIREAMSTLVSEGLIEMEANRYTRVSTQSAESYADAEWFFLSLTDAAASRLPAPQSKPLSSRAAALLAERSSWEPATMQEIGSVLQGYCALVGNPLLTTSSRDAVGRMIFHAVAAGAEIHWDAFVAHLERISGTSK